MLFDSSSMPSAKSSKAFLRERFFASWSATICSTTSSVSSLPERKKMALLGARLSLMSPSAQRRQISFVRDATSLPDFFAMMPKRPVFECFSSSERNAFPSSVVPWKQSID